VTLHALLDSFDAFGGAVNLPRGLPREFEQARFEVADGPRDSRSTRHWPPDIRYQRP